MGRGGVLFRFSCSVGAVGREGRCKQISLASVGRTRSVPATLGLPPLTACVLSPRLRCSGSRLLYRERAMCCVHSPGLSCSGSGSRVTPQRHRLSWACVLCLPQSEQLRPPGAWRAHSLQVQCDFSPPQSQPQFPGMLVGCALCLFWGADLWLWPSQRMSAIQNLRKSLVRNWKPVCNLVGDAISGSEFTPFHPGTCLPTASGGGDGPVCSWLALLWYCSVHCSTNRPGPYPK